MLWMLCRHLKGWGIGERQNELELTISNNKCSDDCGSHFYTLGYGFVDIDLLSSVTVSAPVVADNNDGRGNDLANLNMGVSSYSNKVGVESNKVGVESRIKRRIGRIKEDCAKEVTLQRKAKISTEVIETRKAAAKRTRANLKQKRIAEKGEPDEKIENRSAFEKAEERKLRNTKRMREKRSREKNKDNI